MTPKIIGHRGAAGLAPENTLASIKAGIAAGVDQIEIDVHVTKDNRLILSHDKVIAGQDINLATFAELVELSPNACTLEEAIKNINRRIPLCVECKTGTAVELVSQIIKQFLAQGWQLNDFLIGSFDQKSLNQAKRQLPDIQLIVIESFLSLKAIYRAHKLGTKIIVMNHKYMTQGFVRRMSKSGYQLSAYTLNDPKRANKLAKQGLYGIITDYPDRFKGHKP